MLSNMSDESDLIEPLPPRRRAHDVRELPDRILQTYSRLWQLETWLRSMVYVELRAHLGDAWTSKVKLDKVEWLSFRGLMRPPICGAMRPAEVMVLVAPDG